MVGPSRESLLRDSTLESQFWHQVRIAAANDPALKEMLEQVRSYYLLKYSGKEYVIDYSKYTNGTGIK